MLEKLRNAFCNKRLIYLAGIPLLLIVVALSLILALKFFTSKPTAYSVIRFDPQTTQRISTRDILTGRGIAGSSVKVIFTPSKKESDIKTTSEKEWSFSIPNYLQNRNYYMSLLFLDKENTLIAIKTYNLQIIPNSIFDSVRNFFNIFNPKSAKAQEAKNDVEFGKWSARMRTVYQIYPYIENGEVLLLNREQYNQKTGCDKNPCLEAAPDTRDFLDYAKQNKDFLDKLLEKLADSGYSPIDSLLPYIPELQNPPYTIAEPPFSKWQRILPKPGTKSEIDEDTLRQFIYDVGKEKYCGSKDLELCDKTSLEAFLITTDPILGLNSIVKVVSLPPNKVTDDERLNAFFAIDIYVGLAKFAAEKGISLVSTISFDVLKAAKEGTVIRNSIKSGETIPLPALGSQANQWANQALKLRNFSDYWNPKSPFSRWNATLTRKARPHLTDIRPGEAFYISKANDLINQNKAFVLDSSISRPIADRLLQDLARIQDGELLRRGLIPKKEIYQTIDNNLIVIVEKNEFAKFTAVDTDGFTVDRMIILTDRILADPDFEKYLDHELIHALNTYNSLLGNRTRSVGVYFKYNQAQADLYGRLMSIIYELSTDDILGAIKGVRKWTSPYIIRPGYKRMYPEEFILLDDLVGKLQKLGEGNFSKVDFFEFALTGDDQKLISKILSNKAPDKISPDEFLQILNRNASEDDVKRLYGIVANVDWQAMKQQGDGSVTQITPLIAAGGATIAASGIILINEAFSLAAQGRSLPPDGIIINTPLITKAKPDYSIIITGVVGEIKPLSYLDVSSVTAFAGQNIKESGVTQRWSLMRVDDYLATTVSQIKPLQGGEFCLGTCRVVLPASLSNQEYKLVVYLTKYGSDQILATDIYKIKQGIKAIGIKSIKINGIEKSVDELKDNFILFLGESSTEKVSIPIVINYEDGSIRPTALFFSYQPPTSCNPNDQSTWAKLYSECDNSGPGMVHEVFKDCKGDFHIKNVQFQKGVCGDDGSKASLQPTAKCKDPYPQCGSTIGLENYPATDTILVTPVCNSTGDIIRYEHQNLGNREECQKKETKLCDDLYYYDTNVSSCIHKFSKELYPDCNYIFDQVERRYCGL